MKITVSNKYDKSINKSTVSEEKSSIKSDGKTLTRVKKDNVNDMLSSKQPQKVQDAKQKQEIEKAAFYQLDDSVKSEILLDEIDKYEIGAVGGRGINVYSSEEEVGLKLGELKLKGEAFVKFAKASVSMNDSMMNVVDNFIKTTAESLKQIKEQIRKEMLEPQKMPGFNKDDVFSVISNVIQEYKSSGNMVSALKKGSAFAKNQYEIKGINKGTEEKPRGEEYWESFNKDNKDKFMRLGDYYKEKTGFDELAESWNDYVIKFNNDDIELFEKQSTGRYV